MADAVFLSVPGALCVYKYANILNNINEIGELWQLKFQSSFKRPGIDIVICITVMALLYIYIYLVV